MSLNILRLPNYSPIEMIKHDPVDGILQTVFELGRVMRKKMMKSGKDDLHFGQLHVLAFAAEKPGITMSEIAELMQVSSPTATSFVDRLAKIGLLVRKHDTKNRTLVRLKITSEGKTLLKRKMAEKRKSFALLLSVLSPKDQASFLVILRKILLSCSSK